MPTHGTPVRPGCFLELGAQSLRCLVLGVAEIINGSHRGNDDFPGGERGDDRCSNPPIPTERGDERGESTGDDALNRAFLQAADDEMHYAVGVGLALRNLKIDLGVDLSNVVDTASLSTIYSW